MPSPSRDPLMFRLEMGASVLAILIILGVLAACHPVTPLLPLFSSAPAAVPASQETVTSTTVVPPDQIGTQGAICGGPTRFPCAPGLVCNVPPSEWKTRQGTCVPAQ